MVITTPEQRSTTKVIPPQQAESQPTQPSHGPLPTPTFARPGAGMWDFQAGFAQKQYKLRQKAREEYEAGMDRSKMYVGNKSGAQPPEGEKMASEKKQDVA